MVSIVIFVIIGFMTVFLIKGESGKSALVCFVVRVMVCSIRSVSMIWPLHSMFVCLYLIAFAIRMY